MPHASTVRKEGTHTGGMGQATHCLGVGNCVLANPPSNEPSAMIRIQPTAQMQFPAVKVVLQD